LKVNSDKCKDKYYFSFHLFGVSLNSSNFAVDNAEQTERKIAALRTVIMTGQSAFAAK
jgi:hypothetical protein